MKKQEFDIYITPDGDEFLLNNWKGTWILGGDGYGMPPIDYKTVHGPFQHGNTPIDFFLLPRIIQFTWRLQDCGRDEYWTLRNTVMDALRPNRQLLDTFTTGTLRKVLPDGRMRDISVFLESGPTFPFANDQWDEWGSVNTLRFIAHDPTFFDPTDVDVSFTLGAIANLVFPITFPIEFGSSIINNTQTITYTGTWLSYPVITISGPMSGLVITNETTDETIEMEYDIPAGRTVTIDLAYGVKTVEDDLGTNLIGTLTSDSDLSTFHIAPDPEAPGGANTIRVSGSSGTAGQTEVNINYYTRYIGI